jgi:signal transduction histidine kinase
MTGLRALITDLRPAVLDELGAAGALESLAQRFARHGLDVELHLDLAYEGGRAGARHTEEFEAAVYRIVQEALTNASKHGGVSKARVHVLEDDRAVRLTVSDDGAGFDPAAVAGGFGLLGMRERVELLGGTLRIESEPGRGTTLSVALPPHRRLAEGETPAELRTAGG